jgi:hypothetical protein
MSGKEETARILQEITVARDWTDVADICERFAKLNMSPRTRKRARAQLTDSIRELDLEPPEPTP